MEAALKTIQNAKKKLVRKMNIFWTLQIIKENKKVLVFMTAHQDIGSKNWIKFVLLVWLKIVKFVNLLITQNNASNVMVCSHFNNQTKHNVLKNNLNKRKEIMIISLIRKQNHQTQLLRLI